ncbi:MSHA biogenesis protein MshP [Aeromonas jandaei]|uniref:MSHA biogenesis protein MshP n=1 Tax=Aeromonas jandaei TaxID=650 RepID=UPI00191DB362|nr:MSHA biogenesis protein MshP [Aeromonas jandaei]MBL0628084.1 MSHA biogenesis protein MshP [Aeromonas jandaei]
MYPETRSPGDMRGSALMIALFVIVVMALLAAAMGRFLVDSGEKNTVEVRSVRALLAAQSGLEIALYQLFPNRPAASSPKRCDLVLATRQFNGTPGLVGCQVAVSCQEVPVTYNNQSSTGYRLESVGTCGNSDLSSANPDFAVSRTLMVETFDGDQI